jgi:hypothetical protein
MQPARIIARRILALISTPLTAGFLHLARQHRADWANTLVSRIAAVVGDQVPDIWAVEIGSRGAPAVVAATRAGVTVRLADLLADPRDRGERLPCVPLLLCRGEDDLLEPEEASVLWRGSIVLFCGAPEARDRMRWGLQNPKVLDYLLTGQERPGGWIWRRLAQRG